MVMLVAGKEIMDACTECEEMLQCELFLQGHGIRRKRENVTEMLRCQIERFEAKKEGGANESC